MDVLVKILQFLLSLSILVMLHELGHFVAAKIFKVRVEKFFIFFNPWFSLFRFKRGETEYGMGWLPLGGYVKIAGMIDESMDLEQMKEPAKPYEFRSKPAWQRLIIMIGGVLVNFILAFFIYIMILYAWGEQYLPTENAKYGVVCDSLLLNAGLRNGDMILSLDNKKVENFFEIPGYILMENPKTIQVMRDGQGININLPPTLIGEMLSYSSKGFKRIALLTPRYKYDGSIQGFADESPARNAGMLEEDRVLELDGHSFTFYDEYLDLIRSHQDSVLNAKVLRGSDTLSIPIALGSGKVIGVYPKVINDFEYAVKEYTFFGV